MKKASNGYLVRRIVAKLLVVVHTPSIGCPCCQNRFSLGRWLPTFCYQALALEAMGRRSSSSSPSSALYLVGDAFDGVMGGEDGAFLPGYEVREVVAREVGAAFGFLQLAVCRRAAGCPVVGEAA